MIATAAQTSRYEWSGDRLTVHVPIVSRRRGGRKRLLPPNIVVPALPSASNCTGGANGTSDRTLVMALARAHGWLRLIETGAYPSIPALAAAIGVDGAYVRRMLRLTLLAPDLVARIVLGDEPNGLSLERLRRCPVGWSEQRRMFDAPQLDRARTALPRRSS